MQGLFAHPTPPSVLYPYDNNGKPLTQAEIADLHRAGEQPVAHTIRPSAVTVRYFQYHAERLGSGITVQSLIASVLNAIVSETISPEMSSYELARFRILEAFNAHDIPTVYIPDILHSFGDNDFSVHCMANKRHFFENITPRTVEACTALFGVSKGWLLGESVACVRYPEVRPEVDFPLSNAIERHDNVISQSPSIEVNQRSVAVFGDFSNHLSLAPLLVLMSVGYSYDQSYSFAGWLPIGRISASGSERDTALRSVESACRNIELDYSEIQIDSGVAEHLSSGEMPQRAIFDSTLALAARPNN
ncbi:hypothetical protein [Halioglobus sp. HI00S01]|uniref:hypothetical protein n=1 Tax=Halioglobus sp. HI00S01 TaxID=1822214 RepID=UPI0012E8D306|nr:hypothetical protein [Halioglobus sp. HI00S01]